MKIDNKTLKDIEKLSNIPSRFLTKEQQALLNYSTELKKLAVAIEELGLGDVVEINIKVSKRGRKRSE